MKNTILLVEDDRLVLQMFAMDLEDAGYHVLVAESGDMAMRICADTRPDFALLDMNLPDMSGLDLARWINATLDVPFLFLTAVDEETAIASAADLGAFGYLVKPLEPSQVLPTVHAALLRAQEMKKLQQTEIDLRTAFKTNRIINIAIGLLMQRYGTGADETFDALRAFCRSAQRRMVEVADLIVEQRHEIELTPYFKKNNHAKAQNRQECQICGRQKKEQR